MKTARAIAHAAPPQRQISTLRISRQDRMLHADRIMQGMAHRYQRLRLLQKAEEYGRAALRQARVFQPHKRCGPPTIGAADWVWSLSPRIRQHTQPAGRRGAAPELFPAIVIEQTG